MKASPAPIVSTTSTSGAGTCTPLTVAPSAPWVTRVVGASGV